MPKKLKKIRRKGIRKQGERFYEVLKHVNEMLLLPSKLLGLLHFERSVVFYDTKARILAQLNIESEGDFEEKYRIERDKVIESEFLPKTEEIAKGAVEVGHQEFMNMLEKNEIGIKDTYDAILYSCTVWIWCSFEVLMRDIWEYALNEGGKYLVSTVIKKLPQQDRQGDKIQSKYISIDYLAMHNYDISRKIGTALLNKFEFTSCKKMGNAYACAFPKSENIKRVLYDKKLGEVEAVRNVIVHNAGIIDRDYCERTGTRKTEIGKRISLNNRKVSEYGNAIINAGSDVMITVNSYISYAKSRARKKDK